MRLKDKVAIITGAGGAQGRAATSMFCREGAKVIAADVDENSLHASVEAAVLSTGGDVTAVICDISDEQQVARMVQTAIDTYGYLNVLYNNAAAFTRDSFIDVDTSTMDYNWGVNLKGPLYCCKYSVPHMIESGGGSIINIATGAPFTIVPGERSLSDLYLMAKWAIRALSRSIAGSYAAQNIRSNVIGPGLIARAPANDPGAMDASALEGYRAAIPPMNRLGTSEEVVYCAIWLASDESKFCTGADITIDGAMTVSRGATFTGDLRPLFMHENEIRGV